MHKFFEILPGTLSWLTLFLMVFFSWKLPFFIALFIILFDIYWLLKTIYLSLHLRYSFSEMRKNMRVDWLERLKELSHNPNNPNKIRTTPIIEKNHSEHSDKFVDWDCVYHLIIFPMYREPYEVIRGSFESLLAANYPKEKFLVVLAVEERAGEEGEETARKIENEFGGKFFRFLTTRHPANLPGEIPGKGSNETWAAKEAKRLIVDSLKLPCENILVSVFDIDTQIFPEYFSRLTYVFLTTADNLRAIYQPIPIFSNNIYQAPLLARIVSFSTTFWQMMQQARPERLTTFSSQSIPLKALLDIGFWNTDIVSEDSRIFWQCYLHYHGNFRVLPLLYPVSMDAAVAPTFWQTMKNLYKQQRRWAWGCENIPYLLCGRQNPNNPNKIRTPRIVEAEGFLYDPKIPLRKKIYWSFNIVEGFHSWATNSLMIFALGWLPVILGGKNFNITLLSYSLPQITRFIIEFSMVGIVSSAIINILLLPPRPQWFRIRHYFLYALQWLFLPITLIVFGSFPALESQTRLMLGGKFRLGFWVTPKSRNIE